MQHVHIVLEWRAFNGLVKFKIPIYFWQIYHKSPSQHQCQTYSDSLYLFQRHQFGSYLFLCHHWWLPCKFLRSSVKTRGETAIVTNIAIVGNNWLPKTWVENTYQFDWQFADTWSQVRLHIRNDLCIFLKPVELWFFLQVSNLQKETHH